MRIQHPLLKLPIRFCAETLQREVAALPPNAWMPHPQKFDGNIAVPLVSPGGALTDDWVGPMGPTEWLGKSPYIMEIMQALGSTWGRSRLMGLEAGADVPEHVDVHYYWRTHLRIHVPVITNPGVAFTCAGETVHMQAGECWLLDSFFRHSVENKGSETRVHLVLDTVGSAGLWDLIDSASGGAEARLLEPGTAPKRALQFEQINAPAVMSPWEMKCHIAYIRDWVDDAPGLDAVLRILDRFVMAWSGTWARYGVSDEGLADYIRNLNDVQRALARVEGPPIMMRNGWPLLDSLQRYVLANAIAQAKMRQIQAAAAQRQSQVRLTA